MELILRRELFRRVSELIDEIREGAEHGVPHLVGEITPGDPPRVEISVVVFEKNEQELLIKDGETTFFMFPAKSQNPGKVFFDLWMFLNGKSSETSLKPGIKLRGVLKNSLRRAGFEVIWMTIRGEDPAGYVEVLAAKDGRRYRMLFEKEGDEFVLLKTEEI